MLTPIFLEAGKRPEGNTRLQLLADILAVRPELEAQPAYVPGSGKTSLTVIIGNEVFKTTKLDAQKQLFLLEPDVMQRLAGANLPIRIPRVTTVSTDPLLFGQERLPGVEMNAIALAKLPSEKQDEAARQLAHFMAGVQKEFTSPEDFKKFIMIRDPGSNSADVLKVLEREDVKEILGAFLPFAVEAANNVNRFKPVMTHGDMNPSNILIDEAAGNLTGIIDFGYSRFRLPQVGFAALAQFYPPAFVEKILDEYSRAQEQKIDKRDILLWDTVTQIMKLPDLIKDGNKTEIKNALDRITTHNTELSAPKNSSLPRHSGESRNPEARPRVI